MFKTDDRLKSKWTAHFRNIGNSHINIICFPFAGGSASFFASWSRLMPEETGIIPVLYPMRELRMFEKMLDTVGELADELAEEKELFEKKFIMFSHCTGSLVAYETARRLYEKHGISPEMFVTASEPSPRNTIINSDVFDMNDEQFIEYSVNLKLLDKEMTKNESFMKYYYPAFKSDFLMHQRYNAELPKFIFNCPVMALRGKDDALSTTEIIKDWSSYTKSQFYYKEFSGGHFFIEKHKESVIDMIFRQYSEIKKGTE